MPEARFIFRHTAGRLSPLRGFFCAVYGGRPHYEILKMTARQPRGLTPSDIRYPCSGAMTGSDHQSSREAGMCNDYYEWRRKNGPDIYEGASDRAARDFHGDSDDDFHARELALQHHRQLLRRAHQRAGDDRAVPRLPGAESAHRGDGRLRHRHERRDRILARRGAPEAGEHRSDPRSSRKHPSRHPHQRALHLRDVGLRRTIFGQC